MYIHVRVKAGAKKEMVVRKSPDHFLISLREKAERGEANRRVTEIMHNIFSTPVRMVSGHTSPSKLFSVETSESA